VIPPILKPSADAESERQRDEHGKRRRGRRNGGIEVARREAMSQKTKRGKKKTSGLRNPL
jgi:hypothetical protein